MKYLPIILILLFSCQVVKFGDEQFGRKLINSETVIYHVSIYGDTTQITENEEAYLKRILY
jgi:hypothetical protein